MFERRGRSPPSSGHGESWTHRVPRSPARVGALQPASLHRASIAESDLRSLLEAARWAPSCFNEQPWRFLVATRDDTREFSRLASLLHEGNARWAAQAGALLVAVALTRFERNGSPNRHALHDVGMATMQLLLQAQALGLHGHVVAGFDGERAHTELALPLHAEAVTIIALGRKAAPESLPPDLEARERAPRERRPQDELVCSGAYGAPRSLKR